MKKNKAYPLNSADEIPVSTRKLKTNVTIGFAEKTPKFVAIGKHTVVYKE